MYDYTMTVLNSREIQFENDYVSFVVEPFDFRYFKERKSTFAPPPDEEEIVYLPEFKPNEKVYGISTINVKSIQLQELHIPSAFNDGENELKVVSVGNFLSENCRAVEYLSFGEGIKYIQFVFSAGLEKIKNVMLPSTIEYVGPGAFIDCFKLEKILLPNRITYIASGCFSDCLKLKTIKLPKCLRAITENCFLGCSSLESVVIPDNVELLCRQAFKSCKNLKTVWLPESVQRIDDTAFVGCHPDITFFVSRGSYAHMWAVSHGYHVASAEL